MKSSTLWIGFASMIFHADTYWRAASLSVARTHAAFTYPDARMLFFPHGIIENANTIHVMHPSMRDCNVILGCDLGPLTMNRSTLYFHANRTLHRAFCEPTMSREERAKGFRDLRTYYRTRSGHRLRCALRNDLDRQAWAESLLPPQSHDDFREKHLFL